MNNEQIAHNIKEVCKTKNISVSKLLSDCNIRKSLIYDLEKRDYTPSIAIIDQIADYLECSVDYLLGRTSNSQTITQSNVVNGSNGDHSPLTVNHSESAEKTSKDTITDEMLEKFDKMSFSDKIKVMSLIDELSNK